MVSVIGTVVQAQSEKSSGQSSPGVISGRVVNESGQPVEKASVTVRPFGSAGQSRNTMTDSEGNFSVGGLDPMLYSVFAFLPSYTAQRVLNDTQPTYYRVGDTVRIELTKGGVITGTVTTAAGEPLVGVQVRAHMILDRKGQPHSGTASRLRSTDDRGVYRIYGLVPGTYVVSAGGGASSIGFGGTPYSDDVPTYAPSSTRDTAAEITVQAGQEATNVDIQYRGESGHIVSGIARHSVPEKMTTGVSSVSVFSIVLESLSGGARHSYGSTFQPTYSRGFAIYGVVDGEYEVTAQVRFADGDWSASDSQRIRVTGRDITGLELITKPLGSIKGRVVLEQPRIDVCENKSRPLLSEVLITALPNEKSAPRDQPRFLWPQAVPTVPDKEGEFLLRGLRSGDYRFSVQFFAKQWYLDSISLPPPVIKVSKAVQEKPARARAGDWTRLKSGDRISGLTVTLVEGAASVRGVLRRSDGHASMAFVYLIPAEKEKVEDVLRFFAAEVSSDNTFTMDHLPPGHYFFIAREVENSESNWIQKLRSPDELKTRRELRRLAEATKNEIELKPCQNLVNYELPLQSDPQPQPRENKPVGVTKP